MTDFEQSGKLKPARSRMRKGNDLQSAAFMTGNLLGGARLEPLISLPLGVAGLVLEQRAFRDYRLWTLEQLALATAYLLGPEETIVAGETTMFGSFLLGTIKRDLAVVVTAAHVLVLRIDFVDGQPRWVALAARPGEVQIFTRGGPFGFNPMLVVMHGANQWQIRGYQKVFQPEPVLQAWRQAGGT